MHEGGRELSRANLAGADQRTFIIEGAHSRSPSPKAFWEPQGKARGMTQPGSQHETQPGTALFVVLSRRKWGCSPGSCVLSRIRSATRFAKTGYDPSQNASSDERPLSGRRPRHHLLFVSPHDVTPTEELFESYHPPRRYLGVAEMGDPGTAPRGFLPTFQPYVVRPSPEHFPRWACRSDWRHSQR